MVPGLSTYVRQNANVLQQLRTGLRKISSFAASTGLPSGAIVTATAATSKRPLTAYQIFTKSPVLQKQLKGLPIGEKSKKTSEAWKEMTPEEKSRYEKEAELGGSLKKDKVANKSSAYSRFVQQKAHEFKKEGAPVTQLFKDIGAAWRQLSDSEKAKY